MVCENMHTDVKTQLVNWLAQISDTFIKKSENNMVILEETSIYFL